LHLRDIANVDLPPGTKRLQPDRSVLRVGDLAGRSLNLLRGDLPMPVAVPKQSTLMEANDDCTVVGGLETFF
jgi:hypothetical protein